MATPPPSAPKPRRDLGILAGIFVLLYAAVFFAGTSGMTWSERLEPRLGLDLVGGTRVVFIAETLNGQPPSGDALEQARQIFENRVNALGVEEAEVVTEGDSNIVISKAGESEDSLKSVGEPAELRFRKVLRATPDASASPDASPTPDAPDASPTPDAPDASPTPDAPDASPTPGAADSGATDGADEPRTPAERLAAVEAKIGEAGMSAARELTAPADLAADPALGELLAPFGELTADEVAVLEPEIQFNVVAITCDQLNGRRAGSIRDPSTPAVACAGPYKYYLDEAKVLGTDVSDANAVINGTTRQWVVSLDFTGDGQRKWTELTREAFNNTDQACAATALGPNGACLVAVVLDNEVVSAPEIRGVLTGQSQIEGSFTLEDAQLLASQLRFGALPLTFTAGEAQTVTATLGTEYLKAGLLAAGIGMALVVIYALFYYRLLGSVIFGSLLLSGLLVFGALVVLGRGIGFTLTLAGIAGFIVALGVAADSFVIYFERLKDEIRDGRTPRSAVPRAWLRARRTIISANLVSIMAAVVLYMVSAGPVRGFAFALGLATILDLVVVFLFRHPMMTMLARTRAFLSPRVSGLGRVLEQDDGPGAAGGRRVVKEA